MQPALTTEVVSVSSSSHPLSTLLTDHNEAGKEFEDDCRWRVKAGLGVIKAARTRDPRGYQYPLHHTIGASQLSTWHLHWAIDDVVANGTLKVCQWHQCVSTELDISLYILLNSLPTIRNSLKKQKPCTKV